jgi:hypothetical protein
MNPVLDRLRPLPHRGDVIAAGAVPLAIAAIVIELRMTQWSLGPRFVVVALTAGVLLAMGWLAPLEGPEPRAYRSALLVSGLLPLVIALILLAELLGAHRPPGNGGVSWTFAAEALIALAAARRANSAVCTLIAAIAASIAAEAFVSWVFAPHGLGTFRAILLVLTLAFAAGAIRLRDHRRRHAVALIDAAGLVTLVLAVTYLYVAAFASVLRASGAFLTVFGGHGTAPFGWKLYLAAVGFGLVAYAAVDREPGPAYLGAAVLASFALLVGIPTSQRGSLVGWPLFLLVIGAAGLVIGLRPSRPLPPPPATASPAPTVPLHREEDA